MLRELSNEEQTLVSGGQTSDELAVHDVYNNSGEVESSADNWARMSDGTYFLDQDRNGWFDHAERTINEWTSEIFDPSTREWFIYEDLEAKEAYDRLPREVNKVAVTFKD